jgi:hypothetical protein
MAIVDAKEMLLEATAGKYAVGAFNVSNLIQLEAVVAAAINKRAPVIIQTSVSPSRFLNPKVIGAIYRTIAADAPIPICLHLDHSDEVPYCKTWADAGYTNIMIDQRPAGSGRPPGVPGSPFPGPAPRSSNAIAPRAPGLETATGWRSGWRRNFTVKEGGLGWLTGQAQAFGITIFWILVKKFGQ